MASDNARANEIINGILKEISFRSGDAKTNSFASLRSVDAKVREVKMTLRDAGATALLEEMDKDSDFSANSRRVRLEALANYCRTAIKFFQTGAITQKRPLSKGPDMSKLTDVMPDLEAIVQSRWIEAQRCQHAKAYLAAVIMMGSILEALLLARCSKCVGDAYQARCAPKDRNGKSIAIPNWTLSNLIDVSVERGWLKQDRGSFSHALRQSRNIVHPYEHARTQSDFDEGTCKVCWQVLNASVEDLLAS